MKRLKIDKYLILTILLINIIFFYLFREYFFSGKIYMTIADPASSYYPIMRFLRSYLSDPDKGIYSLNIGLGGDINEIFGYFLSPFFLIFYLFKSEEMWRGIVPYVYLHFLVIGIFAYKYFKLIFKKPFTRIMLTLTWSFNGFLLLWGQHYQFMLAIVYFTVIIYIWQKFLEGDKIALYFLPLMFALFAIVSLYFLYNTGIFLAIYTFVYLLIKGEKKIIKRLLQLLITALVGILIAAIFALPWIEIFLATNRTGNILSDGIKGFFYIDTQMILAKFLRIFSNTSLGLYKGPLNIFGMANLASSVLIVPVFFILLLDNRFRKKTFLCGFFLSLLLFLPIGNYLFLLTNVQRWTWVCIFSFTLLLGVFCDNMEVIHLKKINYGFLIVLSILLIILRENLPYVEPKIIITITLILILYLFIFNIFDGFVVNKKINSHLFKQIFLIVILIIELIINNRVIVKNAFQYNDDFGNQLYNNSDLINSIEQIKKNDNSLYRINLDYQNYNMVNTPYALYYHGTSNYSSLKSKWTENFTEFFGNDRLIRPHLRYKISIDNNINGLIGSKYLITNGVKLSESPIIRKGNINVYKNEYFLPFGYLYFNRYDSIDKIEKIIPEERSLALYKGFYFTKINQINNNYKVIKYKNEVKESELSLFDKIINTRNLKKINVDAGNNSYITYTATTNNPMIILDTSELIPKGEVNITIDVPVATILQIFYDTDGKFGYSKEPAKSFKLVKGRNNIKIPFLSEQNSLRIDPTNSRINLSLIDISYVTNNKNEVKDIYHKELMKYTIENPYFKKSTFYGQINNPINSKGMLAIPLIYSDNWRAYLNEVEVEIYNINSGLVGIEVPQGEYNIKIRYKSTWFEVGRVLSVISLFLYVIWGIFLLITRIKHENK